MIVGETGSGKSTVWKTLQAALSQMKKDGEPGYNTVKVIFHWNSFSFFFDNR